MYTCMLIRRGKNAFVQPGLSFWLYVGSGESESGCQACKGSAVVDLFCLLRQYSCISSWSQVAMQPQMTLDSSPSYLFSKPWDCRSVPLCLWYHAWLHLSFITEIHPTQEKERKYSSLPTQPDSLSSQLLTMIEQFIWILCNREGQYLHEELFQKRVVLSSFASSRAN